MSTQAGQYAEGETVRQSYGVEGSRRSGLSRPRGGSRAKPFFLTSEFFTLVAATAAILIAAAVGDNFDAPRAWTLVAVVAAAYIVSRGLSKVGRGDE